MKRAHMALPILLLVPTTVLRAKDDCESAKTEDVCIPGRLEQTGNAGNLDVILAQNARLVQAEERFPSYHHARERFPSCRTKAACVDGDRLAGSNRWRV